MRLPLNFSNPFNLFLSVQSSLQKYFASPLSQITCIIRSSCLTRGAFRDRHERWVRDAMDMMRHLTKRLIVYGQAAWSRHLDAGVKSTAMPWYRSR
jgi:hypothetical protein